METEKKTDKARRWLFPAIICLFLTLMCGVTFGASTLIARADTQDTASLGSSGMSGAYDSGWYQIKNDGERLSVFLVNRVKDYTWRYGESNDKLRQLRRHEVMEYEEDDPSDPGEEHGWEVHLAPREGAHGEVNLTFVCVKNTESASIETRTLKVFVEDGRITRIEE